MEERAVSPEKKNHRGQLNCLSSVLIKYVEIALTIVKAVPEMARLENAIFLRYNGRPGGDKMVDGILHQHRE